MQLGSLKDAGQAKALSNHINEALKTVDVTAVRDDQNLLGSLGDVRFSGESGLFVIKTAVGILCCAHDSRRMRLARFVIPIGPIEKTKKDVAKASSNPCAAPPSEEDPLIRFRIPVVLLQKDVGAETAGCTPGTRALRKQHDGQLPPR